MKAQRSDSGEFDKRSVKSIITHSVFLLLTFYVTNIDFINQFIEKYISAELSQIIILILAYSSKKYLTNYNK